MPETKAPNHAAQPNLVQGLGAIGKNVLGLIFSRVELAAFEVSEIRMQVLKLAILGSLALLATMFALAYGSAIVVLLNWDALGWRILAIVAGFFTVAAIALIFAARSLLQGGLTMPETLAELRKDRDALLS
jgi:uncharacterized membrane protein YqjE